MSLPPSKVSLLPVLAASLAILLAIPFWPNFVSPNEWPRIYQALAVVHRGSLSINEEVAFWGSCEDLSIAFGKLYPNKAPGLLPLLMPGAVLAHWFAHGPQELRVAYFWGRLLAVSLPWLLTSWLLVAELRRRFGNPGSLVAGALAAGSPWLLTGAVVFSHALAGALLLGGLMLSQRPGRWHLVAAGLAWGWAAVSEYPTALVGVGWLIWLAGVKRLRAWPAYLGFAVAGLLLAVYNWHCFASPFVLSSARELLPQYAGLSQTGFFGISWPKLSNVKLFLFSWERGLVFWAPLLLLGFWPHGGDGLSRRSWLGALLLLTLLSGYGNAHGGWFAGPRYLLAAFPLLAVSAANLLASRWSCPGVRVASLALAFWGIVSSWLPLATFALSPPDFPLAPLSFHWPLLSAGVVVPGLLPEPWVLTSLVGLALAATWGLLMGHPGARTSAWVGLVLAALLWVVAAQLRPSLAFPQKLELAVVHDLFAGKASDSWLEALIPAASDQERQIIWRWLSRQPR